MITPNNDADPPDGETEIEHALEHLKMAEHDLEQAKAAERRAEGEIREAEHEIEEAVEHRNTEIIVNSRPREIHGHEATFEQVVQLAFPGAAADQNNRLLHDLPPCGVEPARGRARRGRQGRSQEWDDLQCHPHRSLVART